MGSLLWKDLVVGKWFWVAAVPIYFGQLVTTSDLPPAFVLLTLAGTGFFAFVNIGLEEMQGTESLWSSLPVSRRQIVLARYATLLLGILFGLGASLAIGQTVPGWAGPGQAGAATQVGLGGYAGLAFVLLICGAGYLPCYFRFGAGRGLQVFSAVAVGGLLIISIAGSSMLMLAGWGDVVTNMGEPTPEQVAILESWMEQWGAMLAATMVLLALGITAFSAALSIHFYSARDI